MVQSSHRCADVNYITKWLSVLFWCVNYNIFIFIQFLHVTVFCSCWNLLICLTICRYEPLPVKHQFYKELGGFSGLDNPSLNQRLTPVLTSLPFEWNSSLLNASSYVFPIG